MTFEAAEEPDYEDEEIAGYMADDETGQATGVEFEKLVEAVRTVNTPKPAEADKQQAAETLGQITGTNLYDAVVANINGELEKVAELLKYATIIVSSLPLLIMYPFFQKYFDQGIMVGSVKG